MRGRSSYRTGSFEVFSYPHHSAPARVFGVLWRWRVELLVIITVTVIWAELAHQLPAGWPGWSTPMILVVTIVVVVAVPGSRRFVIRRAWCVISRHRVRKCFVQSRVMTHEGLLPLFLWTRPTPVGERLCLWLRPGLSGRDIENVTDRIAAACWARNARVQVSTKRASTVWVEVIRRDPLASSGQIVSPLLDGVHPDHFEPEGELVPLPDRATFTPAFLAESARSGGQPHGDLIPSNRGGVTKRSGTRTTPSVERTGSSGVPVTGWSGREDVSDYV